MAGDRDCALLPHSSADGRHKRAERSSVDQWTIAGLTERRNTMKDASILIEEAITELEARLGLAPGHAISSGAQRASKKPNNQTPKKGSPPPMDQPEICKLEFKVGVITKVWPHPDGDKLYCEEIDVGEAEPRQIASGLRPHFTEDQMLGQRLLVVSNLKAKNLKGFKSHGMVLCAAKDMDGAEKVEFVEPPAEAAIGELVTFEGLPAPQPFSAAQVEKRKVFVAAAQGMTTTADRQAAWNGHVFMTSAGPCTTKSIASGVLR